MATATIALCLVILMLAIVVYLSKQSVETSTTDADSGATIPELTEGQTSTKQTTLRKPLEPTLSTQNRRSPSVEPSPPETTPTEIPKANREPLVCTMGERLTSVEQFPPDQLCDYIFYDSLYKEGDRNLLPNQTTYSKSLNTFLNDHHGYRHTTLGLGFAFDELRFTPNLLILFGHYRLGDNFRTNCAIMPPTRHPDDIPPDALLQDYSFDVATPVFSLRKLYDEGTDTRGVVSVTLKGRWAEPQFANDVDFFQPCVPDINLGSFGRITAVCPGGGQLRAQLNYSTEHHAMITYIAYLRRTFVYDDEMAFAEKLCRAKSLAASVPYGIAAYDIDFEDYENRCAHQNRNGAFSRLKALRKVVDYFNKDSPPFNGNACKTYVMT
ncbi:hypothetical protein HPB52_002051 [Rhipicephalus sanguineus]|uniref:Uncharacterized protein n=1 Tax=Rhipicephalus sanguineus TaxID=34632 RepID=A0A9D4PHI8_RHISA|nr:hypothetical protein HPB52_002051 [Rhipicephalus sanguineus]